MLRPVSRWISMVSMALVITSASCAKFVIADRKTKADEPPLKAPTRSAPAGPAVPAPQPSASSAPPPERVIKLTVAQVQPEAWWNSCMFLKVNDGEEASVGCGKDLAQIGKVVELPAKKDFCNQLTVRMKVTTDCPKHNCKIESWDRSSWKETDKRYFKFMDASKMLDAAGKLVDANIRPDPMQLNTLAETQKQAAAHTAKAGNTWIRVWFEDQTDKRFAEWISDSSKFQELGIDWNDYAVDLKGEDVNFTVAGSNIACGAKAVAPVADPAAASGAGSGTFAQ